MENDKLICDFCKEHEAIGVYATDHGPFSLAYCEECLKHPNLRIIGNGLSKWARLGDVVFEEYKSAEWLGCEPQVYYKGEYIQLRKFVEMLNEEIINELIPKTDWLKELLLNKINKQLV